MGAQNSIVWRKFLDVPPHLQGPQRWADWLLLLSMSPLGRQMLLPLSQHPLLLVAVDVAEQIPDVRDFCKTTVA